MVVTRSKGRASNSPAGHIACSIILFSAVLIFFSLLSLFDSSTITLLEFIGVPLSRHSATGAVKCPIPAKSKPRMRTAYMTRAHFGIKSWRMAVYKEVDTHMHIDIDMANGIREKGQWDRGASAKLLTALNALGKNSILLDVGANAGWFTLLAAYHSHKVWAFEADARYLHLLRTSLCAAPERVRNRVRVFNCGLANGEMDGRLCEIWHNNVNVNSNSTDGEESDHKTSMTICSKDGAQRHRMRKRGMKRRAISRIRSLDSLVRNGIVKIPENAAVVVKLDVRGWEPLALQGADSFLKNVRPRVVLAEFAPEKIWAAALSAGLSAEKARYSAAHFLRFMEARGYNYTLGQGDVQEMVFVRDA